MNSKFLGLGPRQDHIWMGIFRIISMHGQIYDLGSLGMLELIVTSGIEFWARLGSFGACLRLDMRYLSRQRLHRRKTGLASDEAQGHLTPYPASASPFPMVFIYHNNRERELKALLESGPLFLTG